MLQAYFAPHSGDKRGRDGEGNTPSLQNVLNIGLGNSITVVLNGSPVTFTLYDIKDPKINGNILSFSLSGKTIKGMDMKTMQDVCTRYTQKKKIIGVDKNYIKGLFAPPEDSSVPHSPPNLLFCAEVYTPSRRAEGGGRVLGGNSRRAELLCFCLASLYNGTLSIDALCKTREPNLPLADIAMHAVIQYAARKKIQEVKLTASTQAVIPYYEKAGFRITPVVDIHGDLNDSRVIEDKDEKDEIMKELSFKSRSDQGLRNAIKGGDRTLLAYLETYHTPDDEIPFSDWGYLMTMKGDEMIQSGIKTIENNIYRKMNHIDNKKPRVSMKAFAARLMHVL